MLGRLWDVLNLDGELMAAGTRAFVAKEELKDKIRDVAYELRKESKGDDEVTMEEVEEDNKKPNFIEAARAKVEADRKARAEKNEQERVKAAEAADLFFEQMEKEMLNNAKTPEEKDKVELILNTIDKEKLAKIIAEKEKKEDESLN